MPDHFHALLTPSLGTSLERAVQYIKGGSARRIAQEMKFQFPVWQRGYSDHRIRDEQDYATHVRYINLNPVKRRIASGAKDYLWSSASGNYETDELPQWLKLASVDGTVGTAKAVS